MVGMILFTSLLATEMPKVSYQTALDFYVFNSSVMILNVVLGKYISSSVTTFHEQKSIDIHWYHIIIVSYLHFTVNFIMYHLLKPKTTTPVKTAHVVN
jgi:hypothetical protein